MNCRLQDITTKGLWDTGAQVSLVSRHWLETNLQPLEYEICSVEELLEQDLEVEGAGRNKIPYIGYTVLSFQLGTEECGNKIQVPFLVCKEMIQQPIIGFNVIQTVVGGVSGEKERIKGLLAGLQGCNAASVTAISQQLMAEEALLTNVKTLKCKKG